MIKKNITPQQTVNFLNELLKIDRKAIESLFGIRIICNSKLAYHPTVQAMKNGISVTTYLVGAIGILNGLFGANKDGWGCIAMDIKGTQIKKFILLKDRMK